MTFKEIIEDKAFGKAKAIVAGKININTTSKIKKQATVLIFRSLLSVETLLTMVVLLTRSLDQVKTAIQSATEFNKSTHGVLISYVVNFLNGKNPKEIA